MLASYSYPFSLEPYGEGGFMASFRDVPEALTEARSLEGLPAMPLDALITAIDFYAKDRRKIPAPSSPLETLILQAPGPQWPIRSGVCLNDGKYHHKDSFDPERNAHRNPIALGTQIRLRCCQVVP